MRPLVTAPAFVVLAALASAAVGCHKSAEKEMAEAKQATGDDAPRQQEQAVEAVARERARYATLLTKEIAWIDRRIAMLEKDAASATGALRAEKDQDVATARTWSDRLREDLEAVEHPKADTADADWSALKMRIDRDLDENRPVSIPRTFEKSYGI